MSGSGNDFVVIDNRRGAVGDEDLPRWIEQVCRRKLSVGADGLILIEEAQGVDFKWRFFNSDGGRAEMCGNGARCAARFAYIQQIAGQKMAFQTDVGVVEAWVEHQRVRIRMTEASDLKTDYGIEMDSGPLTVSSINTGVPHVIVEVQDIEAVDVKNLGRAIRYHSRFEPAGANANFVAKMPDGSLAIRTYERGVEDETLACGTGSVAAALVLAAKFGSPAPANLLTRSGETLTIHYTHEDGKFSDVELEGDARVVYTGELWPEAWEYGG